MHDHAVTSEAEAGRPNDQSSTYGIDFGDTHLDTSLFERTGYLSAGETARPEESDSEQSLKQNLSRPTSHQRREPSPAAGFASFDELGHSTIHKSKPKKMSLTTFFQYIHRTKLPLPSTKPGQHPRDVGSKALSVAISLLQSPETMAGLNPLVEKFERVDESDPESRSRLVPIEKLAMEFNVDVSQNSPKFVHCEITDKFSLPFGFSKEMVYRTAMRNLMDGMESLTDPGSGVSLHAKWTVKESDTRPGEYLELTEVNYIHCNVLLSVYIKSQLDSSHSALHQKFVERFMAGMGHPQEGLKMKMDGPRQK